MNQFTDNPKVCRHLKPILDYISASGGKITFSGQAWDKNCRLWVYFDVVINCEALKSRFKLDDCIKIHEHVGTHSGSERGLVCEFHHDGIMGVHPRFARSEKVVV